MKIHVRISQAFILSFCAVLFFVCCNGCMAKNKPVFHPELKAMKTIAVIPVIPMDGETLWNEANVSQGKIPRETPKEAASVMTDYLIERLKSMPSLAVALLPDITRQDVIEMQEGRFDFELPPDTDAFILCRLHRFRDRQGGDYSVQSPSRVAFDFRVVKAADGQTLFFKEYDETQKPLLDNILGLRLFVKRKGRWISAREMAETAMDEILDGWEEQFN